MSKQNRNTPIATKKKLVVVRQKGVGIGRGKRDLEVQNKQWRGNVEPSK